MKLITLAIHKTEKANILKNILESNGIDVVLENVTQNESSNELCGIAVRIEESYLNKALNVIGENQLFNYKDVETHKIDDGRKRILVAVDFSSYSMKACLTAFNIAKEIDAKVKILHVFHNIYFPSHIPFADSLKSSPDEGLLNKSRKEMLNLCLQIDKKITEGTFPSVNYSYSLREGLVVEEIEQFVNEYKPALLILGTKGLDNNENHILGGVTADIIEMNDVPVLAMPENSPINSIADIKHIAFLTNLHPRDLNSFNSLVNILKDHSDIKITLVHINQKSGKGDKWSETELLGMSEHFKKIYPQLNIEYKLIDSQNIPQSINDYVENENITVICLNTRRRNFLGRIFAPSVSRKVLINSNKALLVLRG